MSSSDDEAPSTPNDNGEMMDNSNDGELMDSSDDKGILDGFDHGKIMDNFGCFTIDGNDQGTDKYPFHLKVMKT